MKRGVGRAFFSIKGCGKKQKRAQVALFVILSLILAISIVYFSYSFFFAAETESDSELQKPSLSEGQNELRSYIDNCIQDAMVQGLEIMRLQAGYIELPSDLAIIEVGSDKNYAVKGDKDRKKIVIQENAQVIKPYWITKQSIQIPSLVLMEQHLATYVAKELSICVNDFIPFKEQGYSVIEDQPNVSISMGASVIANVFYLVELHKEDRLLKEADYIVSIPVNMQKIHNAASSLAAQESYHAYLEDHTTNIISLYSGIDAASLPPTYQTDTNFDCSYVQWNKESVKTQLQDIFSATIPLLKVQGTFRAEDGPSADVYDSFVYDLFLENNPELDIDFEYRKEWDFVGYEIEPGQGSNLIPERVVGTNIPMIPRFCVFKYPFKYSYSFPVMATITDKESATLDPKENLFLEKRGFSFSIPLMVNVCGNQPRACVVSQFEGLTFNLESENGSSAQSLFCDSSQKVSTPVSISVADAYTRSALSGVDVNYQCGPIENNCFMGTTDISGKLKNPFPLCINGFLIVSKKGYFPQTQLASIYNEQNVAIPLILVPENEITIEAKKIFVQDLIKRKANHEPFTGLSLDLASGERVSLISDAGTLYLFPDPEQRHISLAPGQYDFTVQIIAPLDMKEILVQGQSFKGVKGSYPVGTINVPISLHADRLEKATLMFTALSEYIPGSEHNLLIDSYFTGNEDIEAEVLMECTRTQDGCDFNDCIFARSSGNKLKDLSANAAACEKVETVTITKDEYLPLVQPLIQ